MQELTLFISHHAELSAAAVIIFTLLLIVEYLRARQKAVSINPAQATQLINHQHAVVIDIRDPDSFKQGHIVDAHSMTSQDARGNNKKIEKYKNKPVIVVCHNGQESQKVAASLLKQGYNAYSISGGIRAWVNAQMPLVK